MPHETEIKVRFNELDPYAHVNHAAYVTYFEVARTEALADAGVAIDMVAAEGFHFVVMELEARFLRPAVAGDILTVDTWVAERSRASTRWSQRIRRGDEILVTEDLRVAITDTTGKPTRPPAWLFDGLEGQLSAPP